MAVTFTSTNVLTVGDTLAVPSTYSLAWCGAPVVPIGTIPRIFYSGGLDVRLDSGPVHKIGRLTSGTQGVWSYTQGLTNGVLARHVVTQSGTSAPTVYVDGSSVTVTQVTGPSGTAVTTASTTYIGNTSGLTRPYGGSLSHIALWSVVLTAEEAAAYGDGISPLLIRPDALVAYLPITRTTDLRDLMSGTLATISGGANAASPVIGYPSRPKLYIVAGSANPTATASITVANVTVASAATVATAATAAITPANVTVASAGAVAVAATAAVTPDNITVSSAASVSSGPEATSAITLDNVTASSTATVAVTATSAVTPDNVTVASTGTVAVTATSAITVGDVTVSSAATVADTSIEATADITVGNVTVSSAATSEDPQYGRPISDTDAVGWLPSTGSDLYAMIDETTYSDTDYIYTETADADAEVGITSLSDPGVTNGHVFRYRARAVNGGQIRVGVYESTTLVQEWTDTLTDEFGTIEHLVTNEITDYSAIRLRFTALLGT